MHLFALTSRSLTAGLPRVEKPSTTDSVEGRDVVDMKPDLLCTTNDGEFWHPSMNNKL